jgi:hypothetical protein
MDEGQAAAADASLLTAEQTKEMRDVLKRELAKLQGARDVNTVVVKAATREDETPKKQSAASKGFSLPDPEVPATR